MSAERTPWVIVMVMPNSTRSDVMPPECIEWHQDGEGWSNANICSFVGFKFEYCCRVLMASLFPSPLYVSFLHDNNFYCLRRYKKQPSLSKKNWLTYAPRPSPTHNLSNPLAFGRARRTNSSAVMQSTTNKLLKIKANHWMLMLIFSIDSMILLPTVLRLRQMVNRTSINLCES